MILTMELWDERKRVIWKAISQHEVNKERHATNQRSYRDVVIMAIKKLSYGVRSIIRNSNIRQKV
jgi:hypothetical protein